MIADAVEKNRILHFHYSEPSLMAMQNGVIPGLTRNLDLDSCESVEFTGFRIESGMTEFNERVFLHVHHSEPSLE